MLKINNIFKKRSVGDVLKTKMKETALKLHQANLLTLFC